MWVAEVGYVRRSEFRAENPVPQWLPTRLLRCHQAIVVEEPSIASESDIATNDAPYCPCTVMRRRHRPTSCVGRYGADEGHGQRRRRAQHPRERPADRSNHERSAGEAPRRAGAEHGFRRVRQGRPLGRIGTTEEFADLACFLTPSRTPTSPHSHQCRWRPIALGLASSSDYIKTRRRCTFEGTT